MWGAATAAGHVPLAGGAALALLLATSPARAGRPPCDLTLGMPTSATRLGTDPATGVSLFELPESLPPRLGADAAWDYWLVAPTGRLTPSFIERQIPLQVTVRTAEGELTIVIPPVVRARSSDLEGLPVRLCFDPAAAGPAEYPWPPAIAVARARGFLHSEQESQLRSVEEFLRTHQLRFLEDRFHAFVSSPHAGPPRQRLLESLLSVYDLPVGADRAVLVPERLLDRPQRVRVRALGYPVRGRCSVSLRGERVSLRFDSCPLSQAVQAWNAVVHDGPRLRAEPPGAYDEVDLCIDAPAGVARGALCSLSGIRSGPLVPGPEPEAMMPARRPDCLSFPSRCASRSSAPARSRPRLAPS